MSTFLESIILTISSNLFPYLSFSLFLSFFKIKYLYSITSSSRKRTGWYVSWDFREHTNLLWKKETIVNYSPLIFTWLQGFYFDLRGGHRHSFTYEKNIFFSKMFIIYSYLSLRFGSYLNFTYSTPFSLPKRVIFSGQNLFTKTNAIRLNGVF